MNRHTQNTHSNDNSPTPPDAPHRDHRCQHLRNLLHDYGRVLIAYSGGVDSTFLLKIALDCLGPKNVLACLAVSQLLQQNEFRRATELAKEVGATLEIIHTCEMNNPRFTANDPRRCYHCKTELFTLLQNLANKRGYPTVLCGDTADDLNDYRPGAQAARELHVACPLQQAQLTKQDIRTISRQLDLPTWNQPAQPCLASRLAYGLAITPDRLHQVEQAEAFLHRMDLPELRVRHHGQLARIEVPPDRIPDLAESHRRESIVAFLRNLGFTYVTLDLQGFRSGSGNEVLGREPD